MLYLQYVMKPFCFTISRLHTMVIGCEHSIMKNKKSKLDFQYDKLQASNTILTKEHQLTSTKGHSRSSKLSLANITNDINTSNNNQSNNTKPCSKYKKKINMKNRTSTKQALSKECLCSLSINLFCYINDKNWYVAINNKCLPTATNAAPIYVHSNHLPIDPDHLVTRQNLLNNNVKTKILEYIDQGLSDTDICKVIQNDMKINITQSQVYHNRTKHVDTLIQDHVSQQKEYVTMSSVDKLLLLFKTIQNASYIYVQHSITSGFVTYHMSHKEKSNIEDISLENEILTWRRLLRIDDSENILVSFAWCHDDEKRKFVMFPEYLAMDMTFGLNKERRNLVTFVGMDGQNKAFTALRCWMPSKKYVAYDWAVRKAFPTLMGQKVCNIINSIYSFHTITSYCVCIT